MTFRFILYWLSLTSDRPSSQFRGQKTFGRFRRKNEKKTKRLDSHWRCLWKSIVCEVQTKLRRHHSLSPCFHVKWSLKYSTVFKSVVWPTCCDTWKLKDSQTDSHLGRDDPQWYNQLKIMPFIQTSLGPSESASLKATTLHVHNMSLFLFSCLVSCLLNRWQRA